MVKNYRRYRNFMIVFEDDRYYVCKASSFSKNGDNRYSFGDFETIDDAKKRIDEYYSDGSREEKDSMSSKKNESCEELIPYDRRSIPTSGDFDEELIACSEKEEILNEEEDDIPYPSKPNLLNLIDFYMDKYDMDEDNAADCARADLEASGKYTRYFDESINVSNSRHMRIIEAIMSAYNIGQKQAIDGIIAKLYTNKDIVKAVEATNPSSIGHFKKSTIGDLKKDKKDEEDKDKITESTVHIQSEDQLKEIQSKLRSASIGTKVTINGGSTQWRSDGKKSEVVYEKKDDNLWYIVDSSNCDGITPSCDSNLDWGISYRNLPITGGRIVTITEPGELTEDRIVTKDDEINKASNVEDDGNDTIEINVQGSNAPTGNNGNTDQSEGQQKEVVLNEDKDMTDEEKAEWVKNAKPEELLSTWLSMSNNNSYGRYHDDIKLVYDEMIRRMSK